MPVPHSNASVADAMAEAIAAAGVRVAFGHPGGEVVVLIDALRRHGVRFLLTHHENAAAFMALGHGELTGIPGVCVATLGPGATNMVTGVASALLERAPLLALTGALSTAAPPGTTHQALDLNALYSPVAKRSSEVTAENATAVISEALRVARTPRRGSVHLSLPANVATADAHTAAEVPRVVEAVRIDPQAMARARALLQSASRPAIVIGLGAVQTAAAGSLRALAHAMNAPVATLPKAKGVFPEDDPLFAGALEMAGDDLVVEFLARADALVLVGVDPVEFDKPWRLSAPVVYVDEVPNGDAYYPADVELVGDIPAVLAALAQHARRSTWDDGAAARLRADTRAHIRPDLKRLQPRDVVDLVRAAMPRDAIATSDVGAHKMLVGQAWPAFEPRSFFMANGLSSMGYAIPVAAAVRLLEPTRAVAAFVGDGGLSMYLGELETLVRAKLDLLIVVFADRSLELIRRAQLRREVPVADVTFSNPDFGALGRAFGIQCAEVETSTELASAVPTLAAARGIRLLAVRIDGDDYRL
jgi:acetolactate synthase I/II/III large subunit